MATLSQIKDAYSPINMHVEKLTNPCPNCSSSPMCRLVAKKEKINIRPGTSSCQKISESEEQSLSVRQSL